jgi:hypothetical protein
MALIRVLDGVYYIKVSSSDSACANRVIARIVPSDETRRQDNSEFKQVEKI